MPHANRPAPPMVRKFYNGNYLPRHKNPGPVDFRANRYRQVAAAANDAKNAASRVMALRLFANCAVLPADLEDRLEIVVRKISIAARVWVSIDRRWNGRVRRSGAFTDRPGQLREFRCRGRQPVRLGT